MTNQNEKLKTLDNEKLKDVVKNYRQYGYDESIRDDAIKILEERGISQEVLKLTGDFENKSYDRAEGIYKAYVTNSRIAFIAYITIFLVNIFLTFYGQVSPTTTWLLLTIVLIAFIVYLVFLLLSFLSQNSFSKILGQDLGTESVVLYIFVGMPLYIFMFFYFNNQMKEKLKEIR